MSELAAQLRRLADRTDDVAAFRGSRLDLNRPYRTVASSEKLSSAQWGLLERLGRAGGSLPLEYTRKVETQPKGLTVYGATPYRVVAGPFAGQEATVASLVRRGLAFVDPHRSPSMPYGVEPPTLTLTAYGRAAIEEHRGRRKPKETKRAARPVLDPLQQMMLGAYQSLRQPAVWGGRR